MIILLHCQVLGCRVKPRHCTMGGKAQPDMWESWSCFEGFQACDEARVWGSLTLGHPGSAVSHKRAEDGVRGYRLGKASNQEGGSLAEVGLVVVLAGSTESLLQDNKDAVL